MIKHRLLANILIALLIVVSLSTLMVYGLPIVLQSKIQNLIQQETGRKVSLANCRVSLLPLAIRLQNLVLQEKDGKPFASLGSFYIQINSWQSLKQAALVLDKLTLTTPIVHIVKQKNGTLNIDDLFKGDTNQQSSAIFPFSIENLSVSEGKLTWEESSNKASIQPIHLTVSNLSTIANKKCQIDLQLTLESGGKLTWQGEFGLNPLLSDGHFSLNNIKPQRLSSLFLPASTPFSLTGSALFDADYQASYNHKQGFTLTVAKANIELHDFQYAEKHQTPIVVKAAHFTDETDFKLTYTDNAWLLTANKSKISLRDFEFSELTPTKMLIKIPSFTHESAVKLSNTHDDWQVSFKQPKISATQLQFAIANSINLIIKAAAITHESDYSVQFTDHHWQLFANKVKLNTQDVELNYANTIFKTPTLELETNVDSNFADNIQVIIQQGKVNSRHLQLLEKNQDKPLIEIADLAINAIELNLAKQALTINALTADGADSRMWLTPKGIINYQTLFTDDKIDKAEIKPSTVNAKSTPAWVIKINHVDFRQFGTTFEDQTQHKPVITTFKPINCTLTGYSNQSAEKLPFQLNAVINKTGSIQLDGDIAFQPFASQLALHVKDIELKAFQAYFEKFVRLDIIDGNFATNGKLAIATAENQPLDLKFAGDSTITELTTRDQKRHRDFIKWQNLTLKAFAIDLRKNSYTADSLILEKPYSKLTIKKDKTLNFADVFITEPEPNKTAVKPVDQPQKTYFKLNHLQIIDGSSDFADKSLILPFATQIKHLDGGASGISSESTSSIKVSLKGDVYDIAPVDVDGHISPYLNNYDLTLSFTGMPMPLISSYMVEFAGYKVEKGKMSLKLKYKVIDGELTASNNILIDQFELGEKVDNPKAVSLPLEMAVSLLKDSDGKIAIDVPITGSLNDPQFDLGAIISEALGNAIRKVVTSPFQALASLLGDDEENISTVNFKAGNAVLDKNQQDKLAALAKLLKERSALVLDVKGTAFKAQDWTAMKEAALYDSLKKIRAEEINKQQGNTKILPDYIELSDADYKRLLAEQFIEKFPHLARKSLLGMPELIDTKAGDFYELAKQNLSLNLKSEQVRLKELAAQRARAIASYLVQKSGVPNEQVFILDPAVDPKRDNNEISTILSLKAR